MNIDTVNPSDFYFLLSSQLRLIELEPDSTSKSWRAGIFTGFCSRFNDYLYTDDSKHLVDQINAIKDKLNLSDLEIASLNYAAEILKKY